MARYVCSAGCGRITEDRVCPDCRSKRDALASKRRRANDSPQAKAVYKSRRWRDRLRQSVLERDGHLCQECLRRGKTNLGNQVDHKIPLHQRPDLAWSEDNLETLCYQCHAAKTRDEEGRGRTVVVCGPPGTGKREYVAKHRLEGDLVFELESIASTLNPAWATIDKRPAEVAWLVLDWRAVLVDQIARGKLNCNVWIVLVRPDEARSIARETHGSVVEMIGVNLPVDRGEPHASG